MPRIKADTLKRMRRTQGLSQSDMAYELVLLTAIYRRKEDGEISFTEAEMEQCAELLHIRAEALFPEEEYLESHSIPLRFEVFDDGNRTKTDTFWDRCRYQANVQVGERMEIAVNVNANFNKDVYDDRERTIPVRVHSLYETFFVVETIQHQIRECFYYTQLLQGKGIRRRGGNGMD